MTKQLIRSSNAPNPGGAYSPALRVGDFIFTAGQGPFDPHTRQIVGASIEEQTRQTLENVKALLAAGGATMDDVVKATIHLSDLDLFTRFDSVYREYFPDPRPVRTTVGSQLRGFLVEIDVIAFISRDDQE